MSAKKGQKFQPHSDETKQEAVRQFVEDKMSYAEIHSKLGIKSRAQIREWTQKVESGESFEEYRGRWTKKHFSWNRSCSSLRNSILFNCMV